MSKLSVSVFFFLLSTCSYVFAWTDLGINEFSSSDELTQLSELNEGNNNNAIVNLEHAFNSQVIIKQNNFIGIGNKAKVNQNGTSNQALISQMGGNNTGLITQNGNNNSATLQQWGVNHEGAILQQGNDNTAYLTQLGSNNENAITQTGDSNFAAAVNKKSGSSFSIEQTGNQGIILVNGMDRFISIEN